MAPGSNRDEEDQNPLLNEGGSVKSKNSKKTLDEDEDDKCCCCSCKDCFGCTAVQEKSRGETCCLCFPL